MKKPYLLDNFGLAVILVIFINQQALASTKEDGKILQLSDIQLPHTSVKEWLAQQEQSTVLVTEIKLNQTATGLEVILETAASDKLQITTQIQGNNFVVNIPNAQLRLTSGNSFRQEKPVAGITEVLAVNQDANSIQITVVGTTQTPKVELFDSDEGLVLGVTATTPETQASVDSQKPNEPDIELLVTAQKRTEDAQNTPLSLTVIPQQELEDAQINSFSDIANNTPNFSFFPTSSGAAEFNYYSLRGLSNFNFLASQDSVAFYIDDVPFDYGGFLDLGLIDLQRVEVLRGPQSTLYGRSSPSGVVNVISRQPTNSPEMLFAAGYGNYNSREVQLSLSNAVIPDKLGFRFAGVYSGRDGLVDNVFLDRTVGERSQLVGRGQVLWTPTPELKVSFNTYANYTDSGNPSFVPRNSEDPFTSEQTVDGYARVSSDTQALKVNYDGAGFQLTSITARRFTNQDNFLGDNVPRRDFLRQIIDINSTVWSQEIRFQSPESANRLRWLLGGYYESREFNAINDTLEYTETGAAAFGLSSPGRDRVIAEQFRNTYAIFGQVDYKLIEPLTLFAGLRYEASNISLDRQRVFEIPNGAVLPSSPELRGAGLKSDEWIPRFGLQYQFNPNLMAYGTISKGYRPSGFNYRADTEDTRRYGEEKSWTYEVGLKSSWLDNRLTANLSVFHTNVDGYQVLLTDDFGFFRNVANADVNISGVEFELKATPVKGLDLISSVGYVDSRFQNYRNPFTDVNFSDNRVPLSPEFTYNLAVQYRSSGGIFARLELRGYGTNYFDDANEIRQDPFALVNARIGYEGPNYGIYLYANNLFDTRYITSGFFFPPPNVTAGFGDPVTYGVQFRTSL